MAIEIIFDGASPELFSEFVDYKRNLGYVYPKSRPTRLMKRAREMTCLLHLAGALESQQLIDHQ